MRFVSIYVKEVMKVLNIKNEDQLKVWMKWYLEDACTRSGLSKCWKRKRHYDEHVPYGSARLVEQTVRDYRSYYNSICMQTKLTKALSHKGRSCSYTELGITKNPLDLRGFFQLRCSISLLIFPTNANDR